MEVIRLSLIKSRTKTHKYRLNGQKVCECGYVLVLVGASDTAGVPSVHQGFLTVYDPGSRS